jgi:hypothetical protein
LRGARPGEAPGVHEGRRTIRCPGCGAEVELADAEEMAEHDESSPPLTCPTCGAGLDRAGNLRHEPAIGP